jgi:hypothetical protein
MNLKSFCGVPPMSIVIPMLVLLIPNYAAGRSAYDSRYGFDERAQDLAAWVPGDSRKWQIHHGR